MSRILRHLALAAPLLLGLNAALPARASDAAPDVPLEELLQVEVQTASRKSQRLQDVAAAVFVISREDIERSGVTSIPEALRMAPGVQVARLSSSNWAVTARGFNGRFANKLLVLMDGRSIYSPLFSGVLWEAEDTLLEDIDRIEVIRGPGAALWGANAVNGVINIITRHARDTRGTLVSAGAGSAERGIAARHGVALGDGNVRLWAKVFGHDRFDDGAGRTGLDHWHAQRTGLRGDWAIDSQRRLTVSATAHHGLSGDRWNVADVAAPMGSVPTDLRQENSGAHLLARHDWLGDDGSETALQFYLEHSELQVPGQVSERRDTFDVDFQRRQRLSDVHDTVWGLGARQTRDHIDSGGVILIDPPRRSRLLASIFIQDEISVVPERLKATVGARLEHNGWTGLEPQPNLRLAWTPAPEQTWWSAVSRAVRTPSRAEVDAQVDLRAMPADPPSPPVLLRRLPQDDQSLQAERVDAIEAGLRRQFGPALSFDLALFRNRYSRLRSVFSGSPGFEMAPIPHVVQTIVSRSVDVATVHGAEFALDWRAARDWHLQAAYSTLRLRAQPSSADPFEIGGLAAEAGIIPQRQFSLRASLNASGAVRIDAWLRHVGALPGSAGGTARVDAYTTLDLRLAWRAAPGLELSLTGQNLLQARHAEFVPDLLPSQSLQVPRSVYAKVKWEY